MGEQLVRVGLDGPAHVVPEHRRLVGVDELGPPGGGVAGVLRPQGLLAHEVGHGPDRLVGEGPVQAASVVQPHPQALGADGLGQVSDEVTA